ncbi:PREDICTED: mannose/glucose-specific lectin-like isoform X3 [Populus euphratica]|uniref:Mannose/glucose-specific lectin-like isoform X2 n=1 Tax=Populus euphratica TaxID=75702 RepID=A0AAJ6XDX6_POPEU|nr:PREDICTED: mannose/glucose-specific lectin-like isoform X2 [Populus euphratica]XP_011015047.1 PREDICTED: mannose/glucose-specific lectin-like isoform X3 [Populus euphratica]
MASSEGIISLGPWGGLGGDRWSYRASGGITEIVLRVEGNIKSISFKDASGLVSGTFGGTGNDPNDRGKEKKIAIQWPSEHLKSISGTCGRCKGLLVITSLSFITNLTTYGPFGTAARETFSIPIADSTVVGFHGRCGYYLDALGIFVTPANSHGSISVGQWGGPGGDPFSFRVGSWIKEIIVHEGTNIKSLSFKDGNGHEYGKFGGKNANDTGEERRIEIDGHSEHLTSITGTYGDYAGMVVITSLAFQTNLTTYGPFGNATGTSFSIPIEGSVVTGFHGRGGHYLDAIGIHVKPRDIEGTISIGPWGGRGGSPWSYITNRGINQIVIHVGSNIKSISFRDTTGLDSATFGGENPNDIGERKTVLINWPSEHLISISGTYGNFSTLLTITSLSFTTNRATYGPFGTGSGTPFSIPINNNTVVGFHGRAGHYLDAIGIFVKPQTTI